LVSGIKYSMARRLKDNSPTYQLAVSQVADWITRGLGQLADSKFFKNHGITILYLYIKPDPNHKSNLIEYWRRINSVICPK